jgi:hypothetical protein
VNQVPILKFVNSNVLDLLKMSDKSMALIGKKDLEKFVPNEEEMKKVIEARKEEREIERQKRIARIKKAREQSAVKLKKEPRHPTPFHASKRKN